VQQSGHSATGTGITGGIYEIEILAFPWHNFLRAYTA